MSFIFSALLVAPVYATELNLLSVARRKVGFVAKNFQKLYTDSTIAQVKSKVYLVLMLYWH